MFFRETMLLLDSTLGSAYSICNRLPQNTVYLHCPHAEKLVSDIHTFNCLR